jgi:hypothetical protein
MDIVDKIGNTATDDNDAPVSPIVILKAEVKD